jgi:hypothetical protein
VALASSAHAAEPVEGYRGADNRVGCVMYQGLNADGNAVKTAAAGHPAGCCSPANGARRRASWRRPARQLGTPSSTGASIAFTDEAGPPFGPNGA